MNRRHISSPHRGASVVEYALALGAIMLLVMAGLSTLEDGVTSELDERGSSIGVPEESGVTVTAPTTTAPPTTTTPPPSTTAPPGTVFISALASAANWSGGKWVATVEVSVTDGGSNPVNGASIEAEWSEPFVSDTSCVTDTSGTCSMTQWNLNSNRPSTTWTVVSVAAPGLTYDAADNVVSTITVNRPS